MRFILAAWLLAYPWHYSFGQTGADTYHARADQALQSFFLKFWNGTAQYFEHTYPSDGTLTGYWTYAHGWDAVMDGVERTGGAQYSGLIESLYLGQNQRGWTNGYYDDECWMGAALTRAYDLTGDAKYLNQAVALYDDIMGGWDTSCCGAAPGGLWWDKAHTQKATAANGGAALLGSRLFLRTGNSTYLKFAEQVFNYWFSNMVNSVSFQVCDHIGTDGTQVWWRFTYNEGLMIGAALALYDAAADSDFLLKADQIAAYMSVNEVTPTFYGPVLYDGSNTGCGGDCHEFKAPAYRYLAQLYATDTNQSQYYRVLKASADAIWNDALNRNATLFSVNWAGPTMTNADEQQDSAACIALNRFAQLYGPYPGSGLPINQYEAENATLHHLGLEARYGSFTGWGYVAGWNSDGQSVDFRVTCPAAGLYVLGFRYAAGAGDASRLVATNGGDAFPNLTFTNTGAWTVYDTNRVPCHLPAGTNTISLAFSAGRRSANYLNLDNLTVTPLNIVVTGISLSTNGTVHITWSATAGVSYQVQYRDTSDNSAWNNLGALVPATSNTAAMDDASAVRPARFYRIMAP